MNGTTFSMGELQGAIAALQSLARMRGAALALGRRTGKLVRPLWFEWERDGTPRTIRHFGNTDALGGCRDCTPLEDLSHRPFSTS
jgi:hypothetical protein